VTNKGLLNLPIFLAAALPLSLAQRVTIDPLPGLQPPPQRRPAIRVDSNLVLVPVAVADRRNHPVTGLGKENFRVFDEGAEQTITSFAMDDEPVAVGLIFDQSGSVGRAMEPEATATRLFLHISNPEDEFFLVIFASHPELTLPLTREPEKIQDHIFTIKSGGATALYDAVILGLQELKKSKLSRKALLAVSDGGENDSRYSQAELRNRVEENDVLIYAVCVRTHDTDFPLLRWMAELSGGRAFLSGAIDIQDAVARIGLELRNRYVLGFAAGGIPRDGKYHRLRVQLVPPHGMPPLKASWRRGYRAPGGPVQ
jgi:VWFA-related protein